MLPSLQQISPAVIFIEGSVTFFSPCILPLVPIYLTYLTGSSIEKIHAPDNRKILFLQAVGFIIGFFIVFTLLGAAATTIGKFFLNYTHKLWIQRAAGVVIIIFGLYQADILFIPLLNREKRFQYISKTPSFLRSILMGMSFSFGWMPCTGTALAFALSLAAVEETVFQGIQLLILFSLGLAVPFLLTALFSAYIVKRLKKVYQYFPLITKISGWIFVILGILMITGNFSYIIRIP